MGSSPGRPTTPLAVTRDWGAGGVLSWDLGEGLIGRVVESRKIEWLDAPVEWDDALHGDRFGRGAPSTPAGLRSAFSVPVVADGGEVLAVLAFFTTGAHGTDREFVEAVGEVVAKFGRLFGRTRDRDQGARERALLREILDASPVGILIHDAERGVEMVNEAAARLLGDDMATVLNRGVNSPAWNVRDEDGDPLPPDSFPVVDAIASRESVLDRRVVLVRPDGREVTLSVNVAPLLDAEGAVTRVVLVFCDVTNRAANEAELAEKNRQLESFAAVLSHDVRSPLAVATGFLNLARETGDLAYLDRVENAHERVEELIDTLLVLAGKDKMVGPRSTVDLATVVREAWGLVETGDATLDVGDVGDIAADPVRLRQLLENLFVNAAQHAGPSPKVRVLRLADGRGFAVEDDGPGIPRERRADVLRVGHESRRRRSRPRSLHRRRGR